MVCVPRLRTSLLHCSGAFDAFVRYIHSSFRGRDFMGGFLCHRWESSRTVPLSKVRQMVLCQMVVSQQFRAEMCSLRLTQMGSPKCRIESVSEIAWLQESVHDESEFKGGIEVKRLTSK